MAYLNCPFCPSQAFPVPTEKILELENGLLKFGCNSKHEFYVYKEIIIGEPSRVSRNHDQETAERIV